MTVFSILAYSLIAAVGLGIWFGLVHLLTNWKEPWHRVLSVTLLTAVVAVLASLITASAIEAREARASQSTSLKTEPNQSLQRNAGNRPLFGSALSSA